MNVRRVTAIFWAAGLLAGCGNASQPGLPPVRIDPAGAAPGGEATLTIRIRVPRERRDTVSPRYISAATKGLTMAFTGKSKVKRVVNLTPANPRCSGTPLTCTLDVALKPGKYAATVKAYDQAPIKGKLPPGAKLLSAATNIALSVSRGKHNAFRVALDGVPAGFVIGGFPDATAGTGFLSTPFTVTVKDAGGFTIVGTYATPVTLSDTDASGATSIATKGSDSPPAGKLLSSTDTAMMSYTGKATAPIVIAASAGGATGRGLFSVHNPVYVADYNNNAVKEVPPGCSSALCVTPLGGGFSNPAAVAVDESGSVFVADLANSAIKEIPSGCLSSGCVTTLGGNFKLPSGVAVDGSGNVFVGDSGNAAVKKIPPHCLTALCVTTLGGGFNYPGGVAVDASGNVFVADELGKAVNKIPPGCTSASCVATVGGAFSEPVGVAVDRNGDVIVADYTANTVDKVPPGCTSASCVTKLGAGFGNPFGVAIDGFGNVFVGDASNNALKEIPNGCTAVVCVLTLGGGFNAPFGVATL